ncbi:MAG TPA: diacylglycerol kinase family protein [Terriglobia bacterium]|nr:diacylglycerol kinase family protein [Terriglobia bacterium]
MKNATLIYNPIAGRQPGSREKQIRGAVTALENQGFDVDMVATTRPGSAGDLAQEAAQRGHLIIICGGDGTINEAINGMTPGHATLAVLPGGTANIFAKEIGLPRDPVRAARELGQWQPRRIPLGMAAWKNEAVASAEHRFFLCLAGIGFDAYVVRKLESDFKKSWGVIAYITEALRQSLRYPFQPFVCRVEGREIRATFATVQRTERYAGWLHMAPGAHLDEPQFRLCLFKSTSRLRYFLYAPAVILRRHLRLADVELAQTEKVECVPAKAEERIYFELDGELAGKLPATFEIVPDALTVLAPCNKVNREE